MGVDYSASKKIQIFTVEDDLDFAYLIQTTLNRENDMEVIGHAVSEADALCRLESCRPDIILMDLNLSSSPSDGIHAARLIRLRTDAKLIILTAYEDSATIVNACKHTFASGYVFKSQFDLLVESVRKTAAGSTPQLHLIYSLIVSDLSAAEQSVLQMLLGKNVFLHSSSKTIANQRSSILKKMGLRHQEDLIHIFKNYLE